MIDSHNEERYIDALLSSAMLADDSFDVAVISTQGSLSAEALRSNWEIGLLAAKRTIDATTQKAVSIAAFYNVNDDGKRVIVLSATVVSTSQSFMIHLLPVLSLKETEQI
jgi:hypothetical protein